MLVLPVLAYLWPDFQLRRRLRPRNLQDVDLLPQVKTFSQHLKTVLGSLQKMCRSECAHRQDIFGDDDDDGEEGYFGSECGCRSFTHAARHFSSFLVISRKGRFSRSPRLLLLLLLLWFLRRRTNAVPAHHSLSVRSETRVRESVRSRLPFSKACLQHYQTVIQPCMWFLHDGTER